MKNAELSQLLRRLVMASVGPSALAGCWFGGGGYGGSVWVHKLPQDPTLLAPFHELKKGAWLADPAACGLVCGREFAEECRIDELDGGSQELRCRLIGHEPSPLKGKRVLHGDECKAICGGQGGTFCVVQRAKDSRLPVIECGQYPQPGGRRPAGLAPPRTKPHRPWAAGEYFAEMARLEAASVVAFRRLGKELGSWRAPARLTLAVDRARHDEVRHARIAGALAARHGSQPVRPTVAPAMSRRSLTEVAEENAVEGCVLETWGALLATFQAANARDPHVRRALAPIARDETRHASLAWAIAAWVEPRLDRRGRQRVARARQSAARALIRGPWSEPSAELVHIVGLPSGAVQRRLLAGLADALW